MTFMFSANMGEPVSELEKVASGGELSRIALAIKTVMSSSGDVPTMVFDEIDTGVGGVTAQMMAEKIASISKIGQVLCITHLPQIAARGAHHYKVYKEDTDTGTNSHIRPLDHTERINEIAHMLSGAMLTEAALNNAKALLNNENL